MLQCPAVRGFDVDRFLRERQPVWEELERLLAEVDTRGLPSLGLGRARKFGALYRSVSSDLIRARTELADAALVDYLNDLVARAYAHIYAGSRGRGRRILAFYTHDFPRLFRREWKAVTAAAALLLAGAVFGAGAAKVDERAVSVLIPGMFQHDPAERVARDEGSGEVGRSDAAAVFSSWLFTHNLRVTFTVFALGLTFGVGTVGLMFYNGVPLGALAVQYHGIGEGVFFWAWILPHGIPELTVVCMGGAAGLVLARGLLLPGRRRRRDALVAEAKTAVRLVLGGMPILLLAGLIEGTISQMHEPVVPYWLKLAVAAVVGGAVYGYLLLAGRGAGDEELAAG